MDLQTAYQNYLKEHDKSEYRADPPLTMRQFEKYFKYLESLRQANYRRLTIQDYFDMSNNK